MGTIPQVSSKTKVVKVQLQLLSGQLLGCTTLQMSRWLTPPLSPFSDVARCRVSDQSIGSWAPAGSKTLGGPLANLAVTQRSRMEPSSVPQGRSFFLFLKSMAAAEAKPPTAPREPGAARWTSEASVTASVASAASLEVC